MAPLERIHRERAGRAAPEYAALDARVATLERVVGNAEERYQRGQAGLRKLWEEMQEKKLTRR